MKLDANLAYELMQSFSKLQLPEGTTDLEITAASLQTASYISFVINEKINRGELHEAYHTVPNFINHLLRYFKGETVAAPLFSRLWDEYYCDMNATDKILSTPETAILIAQYSQDVHTPHGYYTLLKDPKDSYMLLLARTTDIPAHQEDEYRKSILANIEQVRITLGKLCNAKSTLEGGNDTVDYRALEETMDPDHRYWLSDIASGYQAFTAVNALAVDDSNIGTCLPSLELYPGMQKRVADYLEEEISYYRKILQNVD